MHEYNVEHYTDVLESLWSQAALVWFYVRHDDQANADIEFEKMLTIYKDEKTLPKEIFQIGDIYTEVDKTDKARQLHNQVINEWPQSEYVFNARAGLIKADIADSYDEDALTGIDNLITDFKDRRELPIIVFMIGEDCYKRGIEERNNTFKELVSQSDGSPPDKNLVNNSKTTNEFARTINIWSRIINNLPSSNVAAQAYLFTGEILRYLYQYQQAIEHFNNVVEKWPDYEYAWVAQYRILKLYPELYKEGIISKAENITLIHETQNELLEKFPDCPIADSIRKQIDSRLERERVKNMTSDERFEYLRNTANQGGQR